MRRSFVLTTLLAASALSACATQPTAPVETAAVPAPPPAEAAPAPKPDRGGVLASYGLSTEQGQEIIMAARQAAGWFADEEA